jgi:hypothetical protein
MLIYSYINTRENWENSKLCENTPDVVFPHNFSFSQFPLVLIWLYINTENVLYLLNLVLYSKSNYSLNSIIQFKLFMHSKFPSVI